MGELIPLFENMGLGITPLHGWQLHKAAPFVHHSQTSQDASRAIKSKSAEVRAQIYELLKSEALTDQQITLRLDLDPSTERPRRIELTNDGLLEQCGTALTAAKRSASLWRAVPTTEAS